MRSTAYGAVSQELCTSHQIFGFNLFKHLARGVAGRENLIINPTSVFTALQLVAEGTDPETRGELLQELLLKWGDDDQVRKSSLAFKHVIEQVVESNQVITANSIWSHPDYKINPGYQACAEQFYEADVLPMRDRTEPDKWCAKRTRGMIERVPLDDLGNALILSAVYFNCKWNDPFEESRSRQKDFYLADGNKVDCWYMSKRADFYYAQNDWVQMIQLPYETGRYSLYAIKPRNGDLSGLIEGMKPDWWQLATASLKFMDVFLELPRLKFSATKSLKTCLYAMGLGAVFMPIISRIKSPTGENMQVTDAVQQCLIDLDEKGTKAAALTALPMAPGCAPPSRVEPIHMILDTPFLFVIAETNLNVPLFFGAVANPAV